MQRPLFVFFLFFFCNMAAQSAAPANGYIERIRAAELMGDRAELAAQCRAWYESGQYSTGALHWNYNALMSLETNALLLTQNDNDTYPVWMLQHALGVRSDVRVLNLNLLENDAYREQLIRRENLSFIPAGSSLNDWVQGLVSAQNKLPTYFGVMLDKNRIEIAKNDLYITGLALKFSSLPFDNVAALRSNYENRFRLDYLTLALAPENDPATLAQLNLNYLPAFLLLYRHYNAAGEYAKAAILRERIEHVGRAGNREKEVLAYLDDSKPSTWISAITPKMLEKSMKKVSPTLWAAETETTNAQYERFLQDLLKNRDFEQLEQCKPIATPWRSLLADSLKNFPDAVIFPNGHPDEPEMPVQNIRYESAQRYCAWMTQVYNASTERKKFKKVLFRLPSDTEWKLAARGGFPNAPYPWNGFFVRNSKGCYLLNMSTTQPCGDCPSKGKPDNDGGFFPVNAASYFPNNFGLYNVSGNVAEMLREPGKCKGGSWNDIPYYGQMDPVSDCTTPSPYVGFRIFMEIIEE